MNNCVNPGNFKVGNKMAVSHGRPRGSGAKQKLFLELVAPQSPGLIKKALEMAHEGNEAMLKLFIDRVLPHKMHLENLEINSKTVQQSIANLLAYVESGDMTPDDASKIASILHKEQELRNQDILIQKVEGLEAKVDSEGKVNISFNAGRLVNGELDSGSDQEARGFTQETGSQEGSKDSSSET